MKQRQDLITIAEFARRRGVTPQAIAKGLKSGRIVRHASGKIDDATQADAWEKNRGGFFTPELRAVRIRRATADAQLAELRVAIARGDLLEKSAVAEQVFQYARTIRDSLLSLSERMAPEIGAQLAASLGVSGDAERRLERMTAKAIDNAVRESLYKISTAPHGRTGETTARGSG